MALTRSRAFLTTIPAQTLRPTGLSSSIPQPPLHIQPHQRSRRWPWYAVAIIGGTTLYYTTNSKHTWRDVLQYGHSARRFWKTFSASVVTLADYKLVFWQMENPQWFFWQTNELSPDEMLQRCHERAALRMTTVALVNGGLYIKLGQTLGSLNNLLPDQYIVGLRVLQDCAYPRAWEEVERTIIKEFGQPPNKVFAKFDKKPVGAASLAQVHRAVTHEGDEVAVKVQYADLRERFEGDLKTMMLMLHLVTKVFPKFEFGWILEDFEDTLRLEMDFENEASNSRRCAADLKDLDGVAVPRVFSKYSTKRILTAEFIHGCKVNDIKGLQAMGINVAHVCKLLVETFARQIFQTGFVHSDPHAGNILVRKSTTGQPEVVLLDHGLYIEVEEKHRELFADFWVNLVLGDDKKLKEISKQLGVNNHHLFASMMMQRPYIPPNLGTKPNKKLGIQLSLTTEDIKRIQEEARDHMDQMVEVLKSMPRSLVLVIRNLNLIRSLNRELGAPVNRFTVMARSALAYSVAPNAGILSRPFKRIRFEIRLQWINLFNWFQDVYFQTLRILGFIPKDLGVLEQFVMPA